MSSIFSILGLTYRKISNTQRYARDGFCTLRYFHQSRYTRAIHTESFKTSTIRIPIEVCRLDQVGVCRGQVLKSSYSTLAEAQISNQNNSTMQSIENIGGPRKHQIGENVSRKDKIHFLVNILLDLKDSKESVYGALDAWVAWEKNFPIASLKQALLALEKEQQWHRVVQVIKWMLSKGQGTTMGTYGQLIRALDKDNRAEEAHMFWEKKIGMDLHSVPWQLCNLMISIYYRNNMLPNLVKLFRGLEAFDRKPPEKSIVQKVADAYEVLGRLDEKESVLVKYNDLFIETAKGSPKKSRIASKRKNKSVDRKDMSISNDVSSTA